MSQLSTRKKTRTSSVNKPNEPISESNCNKSKRSNLSIIPECATPSKENHVKMIVQTRRGGEVCVYTVQAIPGSYAGLGKSPHWVAAKQSVYYVDFDGRLFRYDFRENHIYSCRLPHEGMPVFIIPIKNTKDRFAVGIQRSVLEVRWDGKSSICKVERTIFELETEPEFKNNRINVGKCDSMGRLFVGTMRAGGDEFEEKLGTLYKYDNGYIEPMISKVGISNGMAFNDNLTKFYFIDTAAYHVREYDYDFKKGCLSKPKIILDFNNTMAKEHRRLPDGMTIDRNGNLYITFFNTGTIYKFDPKARTILMEIVLPVKELSSAAFGGPNLDILYVGTGARFNEIKPAGYLFKVEGLATRGLPEPQFRV